VKVSFVIPTLNSAQTLEECLASILAQRVPRAGYEIVVADAGSSDETVSLARRLGVDKVVANPLKTGEAGKAAGIKAASGDVIALVDSDNILPDERWLERMLAPLEDAEIVASEPIAYAVRAGDPTLTRYFALLGMNDPLCLFTGNYDRTCAVTGRWTGLDVTQQDCGDYLKLTLTEASLPTIGANGFVFRRALLAHVAWDPYFFDIDVMHQAVRAGFCHVAKVKTGIVHLFCSRFGEFARKQRRRIRDFLFYAQEKQRTYPWDRQRRTGVLRFVLATALVLPVAVQAAVGFGRRPDRAWLCHVPVCWITLWIYGVATLRKALGLRQAPVAREAWQKEPGA
jgi:glycosyltransferase involved in cell wall biosynthesis